jgi:hypothetical protein
MKRLAFVSLVVLSILLLSAAAHAAPPERSRVRGSAVSTELHTYNPESCLSTYAFLSITETEPQSTGMLAPGALLYLDLYSFDECQLTPTIATSNLIEVSPEELDIHPAAQWARLRKNLVLYDYVTGTSTPATIDLTWTATGDPTRTTVRQTRLSPYGRFTSHYNSVTRDAQIAGTISSGTVNLVAETSYWWASISHSSSGSMTRYN